MTDDWSDDDTAAAHLHKTAVEDVEHEVVEVVTPATVFAAENKDTCLESVHLEAVMVAKNVIIVKNKDTKVVIALNLKKKDLAASIVVKMVI
ncbi:hypothetical protein Ocin01_12424, partial [Orchesella cincta]